MQVLEREQIMNKFHEVTARLEQALSRISYENLDISDEVKEQVCTNIFLVSFFWNVITEDLHNNSAFPFFISFLIFQISVFVVHYLEIRCPDTDLKSLIRRSKDYMTHKHTQWLKKSFHQNFI